MGSRMNDIVPPWEMVERCARKTEGQKTAGIVGGGAVGIRDGARWSAWRRRRRHVVVAVEQALAHADIE